jgi:hypothetical protein
VVGGEKKQENSFVNLFPKCEFFHENNSTWQQLIKIEIERINAIFQQVWRKILKS